MARGKWIGFGLVMALMAAGCGQRQAPVGFTDTVQRDQAMAAFRAGRAQLDCGIDPVCLPRWFGQRDPATRVTQGDRRDYARQAMAIRNWPVLAETVLSSGIDSDLTWYYLGVAANGMGLNGPARIYLQRSIQRSRDRSGMACGSTIPCDGVALPRQAQALLTSITPRARAATPGAAAEPPPAAAADPASSGEVSASNWVRPVVPTAEGAVPPASVIQPAGR